MPGKIVIYNQEYVSYEETVIYRSRGAVEAAKLGAVATLIRSITPFSIYSPHTGMMSYEKNVTKIPAACITIEDAKLLGRMADRGNYSNVDMKFYLKIFIKYFYFLLNKFNVVYNYIF